MHSEFVSLAPTDNVDEGLTVFDLSSGAGGEGSEPSNHGAWISCPGIDGSSRHVLAEIVTPFLNLAGQLERNYQLLNPVRGSLRASRGTGEEKKGGNRALIASVI